MAALEVKSEITGKVWKVIAPAGTELESDDVIIVIESMKMEIPIAAPGKGVVAEILVAEGDDVVEGQLVARMHRGA
jgi:acetyl-CoA carboxylase biotin carboxyl carrier protein